MVILGLDPGIARCGYAVLATSRDCRLVDCGCLTTDQYSDVGQRLVALGRRIERLTRTHRPDVAIIERVFFGRAAKTAMTTAQVGGVLHYLLARAGIPVVLATPPQIKWGLTGDARADKRAVQLAVQRALGLPQPIEPDDAADAVAAALWAVRVAHHPDGKLFSRV